MKKFLFLFFVFILIYCEKPTVYFFNGDYKISDKGIVTGYISVSYHKCLSSSAFCGLEEADPVHLDEFGYKISPDDNDVEITAAPDTDDFIWQETEDYFDSLNAVQVLKKDGGVESYPDLPKDFSTSGLFTCQRTAAKDSPTMPGVASMDGNAVLPAFYGTLKCRRPGEKNNVCAFRQC